MKFSSRALSAFLILIAAFSSARADDLSFEVAYGASVATYVQRAMSEFNSSGKAKAHAARLEAGLSADTIVQLVASGGAQLGISGSSWDNMVFLSKEKKMNISNLDKIRTRVLGNDRVLFITYKGGPKELSLDQLKKILTGKVTNWKEVGGEDLPIQIVLPNNTPSVQKTISTAILDGDDIFRRGVRMITGYDETAQFVAQTKGAIGFASPITNIGEANRPKHPPVLKTVTGLTLGEPTPAAVQIMDSLAKMLN